MKFVVKWCWSVADRRLGYSLCLCLCLVRVLRLGVKCVASSAGVLQTEDLLIVCICVCVLLEY